MGRNLVNLQGKVFGRLTVVKDSKKRSKSGDVIWNCICVCGNENNVSAQNLKTGNVQSCGCLARELSSERRKKTKGPTKYCSVDGCVNDTTKGANGMCGMHYMRVKRYKDPNGFQDETVRRENNRNSQLANVKSVKTTTYRKLFGRHEHVTVAEAMIGRPLKKNEHVHHIDGNRQNNDPKNLQVMTATEHAKLHALEKWAKK